MKKLRINFSCICVMLLFFNHVKSKRNCKPAQEDVISQHFDLTAQGISRLQKNIIFESKVPTWLDCGMSCLETQFCAGFNYNENTNENNCQISHDSSHKFERVSSEDKDWSFYEVTGDRMFGCEEENECKNGGRMTWDPIEPFKCKCPVNLFGKLCEMSEGSCSTLKEKQKGLPSGFYTISLGVSQVSVFCDMTTKDGIGVTVIGHDSENRTKVNGYEEPGSYQKNITYNLSLENIVAIINNSKQCEQFIKYECHYNYLLSRSHGWWVSRQGERMNYWGGAAVDSGKCACGMSNTCANGNTKCNCDAILKELREDSGYLNDTNTLPVTQLRFGDTGADNEYAFHTLGKLQCWGN